MLHPFVDRLLSMVSDEGALPSAVLEMARGRILLMEDSAELGAHLLSVIGQLSQHPQAKTLTRQLVELALLAAKNPHAVQDAERRRDEAERFEKKTLADGCPFHPSLGKAEAGAPSPLVAARMAARGSE